MFIIKISIIGSLSDSYGEASKGCVCSSTDDENLSMFSAILEEERKKLDSAKFDRMKLRLRGYNEGGAFSRLRVMGKDGL